MVHSRTEGAALLAARSLAFPERDPSPRSLVGPAPSHAPLAIVIGSLVVLALVSGAFWAGRMYEQRSEFAKALAYAPALEDLTAATRFQDSVSMQYVIQLGRMRNGRVPR